MKKVMRYQIADYLKVSDGDGMMKYALMGTGFTGMNESPSPKVDTKAYIHNRNGTSTITGYETSFAYDTEFIADELAVKALMKVAHDQLIGEDAEFLYCRVDLYDPIDGEANVYRAREFRVAAEAGDVTGEATEIVTASGILHQMGDFTPGVFDTSAKTFTPDAA